MTLAKSTFEFEAGLPKEPIKLMVAKVWSVLLRRTAQ
jgi:hypothetical protein